MTDTGVLTVVRRAHEQRVLTALRSHGAMTRRQLAAVVGLSRTTLSEISADLLETGAIVVLDTDATTRTGSGRPAERLALDPGAGQFLGIDFGHARVCIAVADAAHEVITSARVEYDAAAGWDERLELTFAAVDGMRRSSGMHLDALQGIGVGVPGPFPAAAVLRAGTDPFLRREADVARELERGFGAPVTIDNNTRLAALAEAVTSAQAVGDLLYARLSDGVGGGLVVGGRLVGGAHGLAGELGHVRVEGSERDCRCGRRGCLETVASVPSMLRDCRALGLDVHGLPGLAKAVDAGDPRAAQVLQRAGTALGGVLGRAAMVLDPAEVVVGGAVVHVAPDLVRACADALAAQMLPPTGTHPRVRAAQLSDDDGAIGALTAVYHGSRLLDGYEEHGTGQILRRT